MIHIDLSQVEAFAKAALEEKGEDYVYEKVWSEAHKNDICTYVQQNENGEQVPSCLVGNILHRAGVPLHQMQDADLTADDLIYRLKDIVTVTTEARRALRGMQGLQDVGNTWGHAVNRGIQNAS